MMDRTLSRGNLQLRHRAITDYYKYTAIDYRVVWHNRENLALHFGYHDTHATTHAAGLSNANRVLADLAAIKAGDRVLDAGCGFGGSCLWLAAHRRAETVGVNLCEDAIDAARRVALQRGLHRQARFDVADYTALPYENGSFDVVWALESLCHAHPKSAFYQEAARVLRPGGRLILAEYMRSSRDIDEAAEAMVRRWLDGWAIPDIDTGGEHLAAARGAGFSFAQLSDFTPRVRRSLGKLYRRAIAATPLNEFLHATGLRNDVQHANVVSSLLQYRALRVGAWFYGVLQAKKCP